MKSKTAFFCVFCGYFFAAFAIKKSVVLTRNTCTSYLQFEVSRFLFLIYSSRALDLPEEIIN